MSKMFLGGGCLVAGCKVHFSILAEDIGGNICYELYGMINHYGTIRKGHYTAFVKHYTSGLWFTMNDSRLVIMSCVFLALPIRTGTLGCLLSLILAMQCMAKTSQCFQLARG